MKPEPAKVVDKLDLDAITPASSRLYSVDPVDPLVSIPSPLRRRNSQVTHASITSKQSGPLTVDMRCSISSGEALVHSVLPPTGVDSPGFERSRVLASSIRRTEKIIIFVALMILAIAHSLDNFLRVLYQFNVIDALGDNGFIGAINTIATLSTATLTPIVSKSADIFGRPETLFVSVSLYVLGTIIQACSSSLALYTFGTVFWSMGFVGVVSLFEIIIADVVPFPWRVIAFYLPATPYFVTIWVTPGLHDTLIRAFEWRWCLGGSAMIYFGCGIPLVLAVSIVQIRTKNRTSPSPTETEPKFREVAVKSRLMHRFQQLDVVGWLCFAAPLVCLIVPFAAIPLKNRYVWKTPALLVNLCLGAISIPILVFVEKRAKFPIIPPQLLRETRVWRILGMGFSYHLAYYVQHTYLYFNLIMSYDESIETAGRITGLYTFTSTLIGVFIAIIVSMTRDLRWYLRWASMLSTAAFVIQISHPAGIDNGSRLAPVASQIVLGVAGGLFPLPAMALIQAAKKPAHLATLIGAYMTACRIGGGIGQALAGAIWINGLRPRLQRHISDGHLLEKAYGNPSEYVALHPWGTKGRSLVVVAYSDMSRYFSSIGIMFCVVLMVLSFTMKETSLVDVERHAQVFRTPSLPQGRRRRSRLTENQIELQYSRLPVIM